MGGSHPKKSSYIFSKNVKRVNTKHVAIAPHVACSYCNSMEKRLNTCWSSFGLLNFVPLFAPKNCHFHSGCLRQLHKLYYRGEPEMDITTVMQAMTRIGFYMLYNRQFM